MKIEREATNQLNFYLRKIYSDINVFSNLRAAKEKVSILEKTLDELIRQYEVTEK